ncbi:helicase SRCAP [Clinocottus analis]|uniref:helicase SRCAP n=1 Tax=Clinocottus analis TaxID=304258 RepID=UPI0035C0C3E1
MESAPQTDLPEKLPGGVSRSSPAPLAGDEMRRPPSPPPLATDTQIDSTARESQYGSQTDKETNQIQPLGEGAGLISGTTDKQSVALEYKPETGTSVELSGKEHTGGNIHLRPQSQIRFTAPSRSVPQSSVGFRVRDAAGHEAPGPSGGDPGVLVPPVRALGHQDSKSPPPPLPSPGNSEIKQTDLSKTQHRIITTDAAEIRTANSLESVKTLERVEELVDGRRPSAEILETRKAAEPLPGLHASPEKESSGGGGGGGGDGDGVHRSCDQLGGERLDGSVREGRADVSSSDFTTPPESSTSSSTQETPSKPSTSPLPFDTDLPAEAETPRPETEPPAGLAHSAEAQELVVVGEEAHIDGDWTNMHLNQSYLVRREDGSVCEAAIVNELSDDLAGGEPKLYVESVPADMELDAQRVEVYEFCTLVEEVAEETVCASGSGGGGGGGAQTPHSPVYEMNLFNALLEHPEEYTVKEDLESGTVIISQQPLLERDDANGNSHNLSVQTTGAAAAGQHLVLEAGPSEVCLVGVAAVSLEPTDGAPQGPSDQTQARDSPEVQTVPAKQEAGAAGDAGTDSPVAALSRVQPALNQTVASATKREAPASSHRGPEVAETPSQGAQSVAAPTETKPAALCAACPAGIIHPNMLLFKAGETPVLKPPPYILPRPNAAGKLANAHGSWSGSASEECLPQTVSDSSRASDQTSAAAPGESLQLDPAASDNEALTDAKTSREAADATTPDVEDHVGQADSLYEEDEDDDDEEEEDEEEEEEEEESEDMEQEEATGETSALDGASHISSPEEGSDEEPDADKTESEMTLSSPLKVHQWMADRVTADSSPVSPSPSSSYPGASPASDWSAQRRDKSSPLRGPHGKFVSPGTTGSGGGFGSSSSTPDQATPQRPRGERHTDMAELAKHEADIEHRTQSLRREGCWSTKRLTRLTEPPRPKVHWDYLCEEMQWLSADFAQERRWKRGVARKVVRMVMRHHEELRQKEEKAKRDEHSKIRRVASSIAKEVRAFWSSVEKVVQYKQQSRLEEKRKKALDLQLDFIVGQTEKYSDLLSKSLAPSRPADAEPEPEPAPPSPKKTVPPAAEEDDRDFEPPCEEEDDEATIDVEEQQEGNDAESHRREIELLKEEGMLPLEQLLDTLKLPQETGSDAECSDETSSSVEEEDGEFTANVEDARDEEDTIAAQEKVEGNVDHAEELDDLAKEGDMSVEELLEKYKGAYASDFEAPSASGSKDSSDSEVSGDEEEESDEDESDVESNSSSSDSQGDSGAEDDSEEEEEEDEEEGEESEEEDDGGEDEGMEVLLKEGDHSPPPSGTRPKKEISHIAATAESLQPKGYTLATAKVKTPIPFLLHGQLREYQHIGLDWLVTMYEKKLNGILADEMGLGKTIQTIALLAHLACEKSNWGPHLIIVPTSVMLNWEMELKRWCPGFKILTYFGSQKERKLKRQGWTKPNAFHVCITSYKLVLQDHQAFRRKSWRYLILDEAQNIKNFKSQRWQSLLNFNSHRRLLLTGTPLQNSLMELWSLMHFLMPHVFQSHREFKEWFSNPLTGMIEGSQEYNEGLVKRLHKVLRPFLLRRIKVDVEKQMPKKYEHVVRCRLSKRQRFLYDDFMAQASTREMLASGHFMSVINILMQLRKVCNHPNLFDPRPIQSPFITKPIVFHTASLVQDVLELSPLKRCDLSMFDLVGLESRVSRYQADVFLPRHKVSRQLIQEILESPDPPPRPRPVRMKVNRMFQPPPKSDSRPVLLMNKPTCSVPPAAQTPKPTPTSDASSPPPPAPVVQQVVCTVSTAAPPRPSMHAAAAAAQIAVRSSGPRPVLTVRPPAASCVPAHPSPGSVLPQRVLLSPDMQARLPSGEVVSIAQLASLAGRPVSSCQGSKPVTFQLQGNKLTLSGAQIHQVPAAAPRPVQGNVMHLVSSGAQHHLISQPAPVAVQSTAAPPTNRLPLTAQAAPSLVSSPGVVKIVVRQTAGKDGGPVPTLAVAPSPRVAPQASPSLHPHTNTTTNTASSSTTSNPVRNTAPLQIAQRTPGPATATAHYTIAPPGTASPAPNQPHPPRPVLKVVQPPPLPPPSLPLPLPPPPAASAAQTASVQVASSSSAASKSSPAPRDGGGQTAAATKSRLGGGGAKAFPPARRVPRPPPRSPFYTKWLADANKQRRDGHLDFIIRTNESHCAAKPVYGREVLDFLTFLPGPRPAPAGPRAQREWGRSGHSSALYSQWSNKYDFWFQSRAVSDAISGVEDRLELLKDVVDRFTFAIPPVAAPQISMHSCHPPPSLTHKQAVFSSLLATQVTPRTRCLHRIQCYMRTLFPDLRLIQYDCGKLQTLHTLLRKLKTGGHRVLIFTQMTRMLDVLEQFLNYHGHIYLRLDGSTRVEMRQSLMERFNADRRIFCFILSTRSGGVGVNLTGADTVVFYDSDWNPTMDAQAQDRCHRIGQTRDVHIYRLISERTVEENILKKANQKRLLGDMAIEGGNFTTAFFKQQTIRDLFDMTEGEKREMALELTVPQVEEEETGNKHSTTILEQALCRAEDEEDIVAASQAKAEQVAELAEFNENIPLDDGGDQEEVEELSKAEQEIAALVEQLTPIERYAMNFLEASLEDVCKEELKQAEEQVEAARKGLDQAKEEALKLHASSGEDEDDPLAAPASAEPSQPARRGRKPKDKDKVVTSTRTSGRLRGASPETEPEPAREVPERLRCGLRGRGAAKDASAVSPTDLQKTSASTRLQDSTKSSPVRDPQTVKTRTLPNRSHASPVPSPPTTSPAAGGKQQPDGKTPKTCRDDKDGENERKASETPPESGCPADNNPAKDDEAAGKDHSAMSPPSTSSRSPRKRQSADGEVLRGLVEDCPSAKVLRKLPGRLVTVVEEKEPKKRRRRGSGTGGGAASSEEAPAEENAAGAVAAETNKDNKAPSPDGKTKGAVSKSPQDQDSSPAVHPPPPVRSYPPYSPPHLSPDMPVLRNLPVRRRLETESRMAAQLGEQQHHLGRGRGWSQSRKTENPPPGKDATESNSLVTPLKRKRGRPPKTPPRLATPDNPVFPSPQSTSPSEEGNPPLSPKRKRGRPRKDSTTTAETAGEGQNSKNETAAAAAGVSDVSKPESRTEPTPPSTNKSETPKAAAVDTTSRASQSTKAEETDTKTEVSTPTPNPAPCPSTTDEASVRVPIAPSPLAAVASTSAQCASSAPASAESPNAALTEVSCPVSTPPAVIPATPTAPLPLAGTVASTPAGVQPTLVVSTASTTPVEPKPSVSTTGKAMGPHNVPTVVATPLTASSSPVPVDAVPASAPALTIATSVLSHAVGVAPAVTTTVKSVTTKTTAAAAKDLPKASAVSSPSPTPTPAIVTSAPAATRKLPPAASPTSTSCPTAATTVETTPANPTDSSTVRAASPTLSASTAATVSLSAARTVASSPNQARTNVTTTKPVAAAQAATRGQELAAPVAAESSAKPCPVPTPTCSPSPTATSASATATTEAKTVTGTESPPAEKVQETIPVAAAAPSKEHTTAEKTVTIPPLETTSTPNPLPTVTTTTTSSPEKSTAVATSTAASLVSLEATAPFPVSVPATAPSPVSVAATAPSPVSVAATAAASTKAVPPGPTTQASVEIPLQVQSSASCDVSTPPAPTEALAPTSTSASSSGSPAKLTLEPVQKVSVSKGDLDTGTEMEVDAVEDGERTSKEGDDDKEDMCKSLPKRRKVESPSETKDLDSGREGASGEAPPAAPPQKEEAKQQKVENTTQEQTSPIQKRPLSRQSSQESTRSSSSSSGCSTSTLTRHAHHKRTYENRLPVKKRRMDVTSETGKEEDEEEENDAGGEKGEEGEELASSRGRSRSSSSSSGSDRGESRKERRLTRSAKRGLQDQEGNGRQGKKKSTRGGGSGRNPSNNANASTGGESGSDASSVARKSWPSQDGKAQTNSAPSLPPEPEVLGKRCSALNAAAKLLAMKGRVDTPGHTPRRDSAAKASDKNQKPKSKTVPASPPSNSVNLTNNKSGGSKPSTANPASRPASRSTRQCPGSLVPPMDLEHRRCRGEDRGGRKSSGPKEGEAEVQPQPPSSRGHSACSSMSSDGSRSRSSSSSNSSQRTHSISSQNTEHSERGGRSRSESRQHRASRRDRRSHKLSQEAAAAATSGSGTEGTPDRVLRSVAALAAVQARSPAASTRSSSGQHRHSKT